MESKIQEYNSVILSALSEFINNCPDAITAEMVKNTMNDCGFSAEQSYRVLLSGALGLYENREIMRLYMNNIVKKLDFKKYADDPYYRNIRLSEVFYGKNRSISIVTQKYKPYELFVYNNLRRQPDGRIIPCVGFFECEYSYPCILQNGREWMMITPNEIETMSAPLRRAHGKVLTYGLGLGYFAFMACAKFDVDSVTVVEKDCEIISLFKKIILPQFPRSYAEKLDIINADALYFAAEQKLCDKNRYDFIFADIWHDPSDGKKLYLLLKSLERTDAEYSYWIEDTIKCYL